jgi:hypothetical protein
MKQARIVNNKSFLNFFDSPSFLSF